MYFLAGFNLNNYTKPFKTVPTYFMAIHLFLQVLRVKIDIKRYKIRYKKLSRLHF